MRCARFDGNSIWFYYCLRGWLSSMKYCAIPASRTIRLLAVIGVVSAVGVSLLLGLPNSLTELRLVQALKSEDVRKARELNLSDLAPGNWETVCGSGGYGGEFYVERYKRTYPAIGALHDGSWGLIFIEKDGSYKSAVGNCASPGVYVSVEGCMERARAILSRKSGSQQCPRFARNDG